MKRFLLLAAALSSVFIHLSSLSAAEPLRVFIRSGPKSHGPGAHDHPSFLRDWVPMLNERGAKATGGDDFPTKAQLDQTDVIILHRDSAGNFKPEERALLDEYTRRGGGIVVIHAGSVADTPEGSDYYKELIGGSWRRPQTKWLEGPMNLYFTDRDNPITKDCSNFEVDDEVYYDMDVLPSVHILAAAYTPKPQGTRNEKAAKRAEELTAGGKKVSVYDIQPQVWTHEKDSYRAFVCIPGHYYKNFSHPVMRALILRGIAWAGKRANADELLKADELGDNLRYVEGGPTHPNKAAEKLEVHPEFNISLVASEPLVNKVMNVDWDEKGRMWVCETPEYPNGRRQQNTDPWKDAGSLYPGKYEREPQDRISWLESSKGDGVMDKKHVFADKLELVTSFCFYKNGVIACSAPDIWFLEDTTGKGVCDKRTKLYTGLGTGDTHAVINNLRWGLDGWIYATHGYSSGHVTSADGSKDFGVDGSGVVRFKPDGSAFEQYSSRGGNTWGLCMTWDGQCFWTQPTSGTVFFHTVLPESVLAKGKIPGTTSWKGMISGQKTYPLMKWEQQAYVQIDQVGAYTAAAGCAIYEGGAWPDKWNYSYFTGEPTINIISQYFVKPDGVSYSVEKEKGREETEFIRSRDMWFRPIETRIGPDGALYIVDFYNQAVIHNDTRGPLHGPANAAVRPDRDHYFSRIWRVQHKQAKKLEVPVLDKKDKAGLIAAAKSNPNAHVRLQAVRLLSEETGVYGKEAAGIPNKGNMPIVGSEALRTYNSTVEAGEEAKSRSHVIDNFVAARDDWSKSAIIAGASDHASAFVEESLKHDAAHRLDAFVSALLPVAIPKSEARLLTACASAPSSADGLKKIILEGIAQQSGAALSVDSTVADSLKKLLANPATAGAALPLVAKWDTKGVLADVVKEHTAKFSATLANSSASIPDRINAAKSLISVGGPGVQAGVKTLADESSPPELQTAIIHALDEAGQASAIVPALNQLKPALQQTAFDAILKRPEATHALLEAVSSGKVDAKVFGPSNVARLRTHPNKQIAKQANAMLDKLVSPATKEKNAIIAKLTPEVEKPGNAANGKILFTGTCATCHKLGDIGKDVAPPLAGMGAHGPAELLIHVIDPNREVDPSFYQWNITKKNGDVLVGVVAQENQASLTLKNQAGDFEVRKDDIKTRENTHRSLMPEGFEALGAESLRDILAYICGSETRYRIVDLKNAFTADSLHGIFRGAEHTNETVTLNKFGNVLVNKVPFHLVDPAKSATASNIIALKGGGRGAVAHEFPKRVEISTNATAASLHFLGGVAGWAWPYGGDSAIGKPAMKVSVEFADGDKQDITLENGEHFADYIGRAEVPKSEQTEGLVSHGQLRYFAINLKKKGQLKKIALESFDNEIAPCTVAITADTEKAQERTGSADSPVRNANKKGGAAAKKKDSDKTVGAPSAASPVVWEASKTKVIIIAGGSSHDFKKWFEDYDGEFLKKAGFSVNATEDTATAIEALKAADVAVISTNKPTFDVPEYHTALFDFIKRGKGVIMLHPGTWYGFPKWPEINAQVVGGGARGHDAVDKFTVSVLKKDHPVMAGVVASFDATDELYYINAEPDKIPAGTAAIDVLAQTSPSKKFKVSHPSVWVTKNDQTKIVGIALGHDGRVHELEPYQKILINAVKWTGGK